MVDFRGPRRRVLFPQNPRRGPRKTSTKFFERWRGLALAVQHGFLVAFGRFTFRLFGTETQRAHHSPDMDLAEADAIQPFDERSYACEYPQPDAKAMCQRTLRRRHGQTPQLAPINLRSPACSHDAQRLDAALVETGLPCPEDIDHQLCPGQGATDAVIRSAALKMRRERPACHGPLRWTAARGFRRAFFRQSRHGSMLSDPSNVSLRQWPRGENSRVNAGRRRALRNQ